MVAQLFYCLSSEEGVKKIACIVKSDGKNTVCGKSLFGDFHFGDEYQPIGSIFSADHDSITCPLCLKFIKYQAFIEGKIKEKREFF